MLSNTETISSINTSPNTTHSSLKKSYSLPSNNKARLDDHPFSGTKSDRKFEYINCDDAEQMKDLFSESIPSSSENKNHGKYLTGKIISETEQEIAKHIGNNALKFVKLRVRSPVRTMLTARIVLNDNQQTINMSDFLNSDLAKRHNITAFTLLLPDQDEKRGIRCRIDEDGTKIYEVANGSYEMNLKWYVEGMECNIKINLHDDSSVELVEHNSVTIEQLKVNKIKVGRQYEARPLHEVLESYMNQETVKAIQAPKASIEDIKQQPVNLEEQQAESPKGGKKEVGRVS
ncbi:hypothetical protein [Wolbachia endosymbiont of Chironomus riparius]|uniref:hypothetical protein n=1 Tax=Wolbachia endosymbiont of Chironomus riparius TaxID=2883238 RepID=UPI00209DD00F|nr:hypothetical protein [Wolbachia endosymbiont of Chironomus riparius]